MIRVDRSELTKNEIIRMATNRFLNDGYSKTSIHAICKDLNMSTGNLTFHFPTKEHLLAKLVDMLCAFQQKLMEEEAAEGTSSLMALCLELLTIAAACEQDAIAKDFFLSSYRSEMAMEIIRKIEVERAKQVFREYCTDWSDAWFEEAAALVSGIEYATLMTTANSAPLEVRIGGALKTILGIYRVPLELRETKIKKALTMDYRALSLRILKEFREYVDRSTEQALLDLMARK